MTSRFFIILFLVLDVLAFVAVRGFGGDTLPDKTEPARAIQQIHPDYIKILDEARLRALERPCLAWSGLTPPQSNKLLSLLNTAGIQAAARDVQRPPAWKVRIPPLPTREAAEILAENMASFGIGADSFSIEEVPPGTVQGRGIPPGKFAIVFGQFENPVDAANHLETVKARGVPNAGIEEIRSTTERQIQAVATADKLAPVLAGQPFATLYKACPQ
ncbi:MAG: hypothetical protein LBU45_03320 [Azoarcus sp.]|jgi:hypothetical protein|nr:hypothetical protein [Azoarcus sp.]